MRGLDKKHRPRSTGARMHFPPYIQKKQNKFLPRVKRPVWPTAAKLSRVQRPSIIDVFSPIVSIHTLSVNPTHKWLVLQQLLVCSMCSVYKAEVSVWPLVVQSTVPRGPQPPVDTICLNSSVYFPGPFREAAGLTGKMLGCLDT